MPNIIKILDTEFKILIPHEAILLDIKRLAGELDRDLGAKNPLFLVVLKGAFMFASELMKELKMDPEMEFIRVKSYVGKTSSDPLDFGMGEIEVEGRTVVIVEDIVDTGKTLVFLRELLKSKSANEVYCASLFLKPEAGKKTIEVEYVGCEIPNRFVLGFGLDYEQKGRGLKDLYVEN